MRKFNVRGLVARRMMGVQDSSETEAPVKPEMTEDASAAETTCGVQPGEKREDHIRIAWRTDIGKIRRNNQDALILGNGLAGVADGMGGHNGGEIASCGLRDGLLRETVNAVPDPDYLDEVIQRINLELWNQQEADASLSGMGTTLTLLWPTEKEMIVAQVGDSRAYLLRGGTFKQVTADHSMVADMVRRGVLTEEQAACHPMRNVITRAVGTDDTVQVDIQTLTRERGDRWLVCSDGLYGTMKPEELAEKLAGDSLEDAANRLLETALERGGKDNISLIIIDDEAENKTGDAVSDPSDKEGNGNG